MLSLADFVLIVVTTVVCTGIVTTLAWLVLRANRRGPITSQFSIVIIATVVAIVCSTIAVLVEMYFSAHDLVVLSWVVGVSGLMSLAAAALVTIQFVRPTLERLTAAAQRIGDGAAVVAGSSAWREFAELEAELADASIRLERARAEIETLDAARRQFFAWISHDLRTPLAGLAAMTEALEAHVVDDPDEYIHLIGAKVETLNRMVDDLFRLSQLQSGTLPLHPEIVVLLDLISDAVSDVQPVAARRGIQIVDAGVAGHLLWADPRELTRAIGNLLANSIRHAPDGSEIIVSVVTREDGHLVVSVLDHGSGVASEDLGRIFDVGWRADTARTTDAQAAHAPGAGLGLAIVRGIVEAHGGNVEACRVADGFRVDLVLPAPIPA
ncbi:HAMP domain-containing sensor histidine kinase [Microbacterium deminutum]|uniref:histidine kinase n=1 Tax=Microbacterium deminutum TaxID=344164 RepID=A0ABP5CJR2_9MICO